MHSYTPPSSGNTAPLMVRTEVVIPLVTLVTVPATRSKSTSGAVDVSVCLLVGMTSPFSLQLKVGVGVPSEVQVRVRLPPSMTDSVGDWVVVVVGGTGGDRGMDSISYSIAHRIRIDVGCALEDWWLFAVSYQSCTAFEVERSSISDPDYHNAYQ